MWEQALIGGIVGAIGVLIVTAFGLTRTRQESANVTQAGGITPLMKAVLRIDDTSNIEKIIKDGAIVDAQDEAGMTALMYAVVHDYYDAVELLVRSGANVHLVNQQGDSARDMAVNKGASDITALLESHKLSAKI